MLWVIFVIVFAIPPVAFLFVFKLYRRGITNYANRKENQKQELEYKRAITPRFKASEYLERIEAASLEILEKKQLISKVVTLWWGLDGLRINEDGTTEWISRTKRTPVPENVFYQPCQSIQPIRTGLLLDQTQSSCVSIDILRGQLSALGVHYMQTQQNESILTALQPCCMQYPSQYPLCNYGWR